MSLPTETHRDLWGRSRVEAAPHEGTQASDAAAGFGVTGSHPPGSGPAGLFVLPEG